MRVFGCEKIIMSHRERERKKITSHKERERERERGSLYEKERVIVSKRYRVCIRIIERRKERRVTETES